MFFFPGTKRCDCLGCSERSLFPSNFLRRMAFQVIGTSASTVLGRGMKDGHIGLFHSLGAAVTLVTLRYEIYA